MKTISIVVPCFNEEEVIRESCAELSKVFDNLKKSNLIADDSGLYFIDDGSKDRTWSIIEELASQSTQVHGIKLSRNRGHQYALLAGLLSLPRQPATDLAPSTLVRGP